MLFDAGAVAGLVAELRLAGFTEFNLQRIAAHSPRTHWFNSPILFTAEDRGSTWCAEPLRTLLRLFQEGDTVPRSESGISVDAFAQARLVETIGTSVRALVALVPWGDFILASDRLDRQDQRDWVFAPNDSTERMEKSFPILQRGDRALDIGMGSGALSIALARRGLEVHSVDLTERSQEFVRLNCALNGVACPELHVADNRFLANLSDLDLVVFNAPRTYALETAVAWGGQAEGQILEAIRETYRLLPASLAATGFAIVRHECLLSKFSAKQFVEEFHVPDELEVLYFHESAEAMRDLSGKEPDLVAGSTVIRKKRSASAPTVQMIELSHDEIVQHPPRFLWKRIVGAWPDALR